MRSALKWALPLILAVACTTPPGKPTQPRQRSLMTGEEVVATHASTLYDAIQQAHPEFLRTRGFSSISNARADVPRVFVDNMDLGDVQILKSIYPNDVAEVRRFSAEEATTRWGTGYVGGAIAVVTHSGKARARP